jgi:CubicO group peptidase (beta-lactamase class C family)
MKGCKLYLFLLVLIIGAGSVQGQDRIDDTTGVKLRKAIENLKEKYRCPGVSVAIVHEDNIVYDLSLGYTDLENKTAVTMDSKFPVMSITKTFTATMLMQLREKGVVKLDDPVKKYIPEYTVSPTTTLFQLATHNSGLPRNSPADMSFTISLDEWMLNGGKGAIKGFATDQELLRSLRSLKLEYPPFDYIHPNDRHYSNMGYELLGIALERAAKEEYTAYVIHHICQPLGMTHTGFLNDPGIRQGVAKGYRYNAGHQDSLPFFDLNSAIYAGGLYSTAGDLCKFISSQWTGESQAMMRQLKIAWKPAFPYVLHEGGLPGYRSIIVFNPETKLGWVILTNGNDVDFNEINGSLAEIAGAVYKKRGKTGLTQYTGKYKLPGGYGDLTMSLRNDSLYSTYLLPDKALTPDGGLRWKAEGSNGHSIGYEFVGDGNGKITALKLGQFVWYKD